MDVAFGKGTRVGFTWLACINSLICAGDGLPGEPMEIHFAWGFAWVASIRYSVAYFGESLAPGIDTLTERFASVPSRLQKLKNTLIPTKLVGETVFEVTRAAILVLLELGGGGAMLLPLTAPARDVRPASDVFKRHVELESKNVQNTHLLSARQASQHLSTFLARNSSKSNPARSVLSSTEHLD